MWLLSASSGWGAGLADEKDPCGAGRGDRAHCGSRLREKGKLLGRDQEFVPL